VIPFSVFALSFATLGYELALARWLAIAHWDTLAFIVIGIAMFGLAAVGVVWQAFEARTAGTARGPVRSGPAGESPATALCLAGSVSLAGSFLIAKLLPLDWLRLPVDPAQVAWLAAAGIVLSLPFLCSGVLSCLAYAAMAPRAGIVSAAGMAGSAAGAVSFLLLLPVLEEGRLIAVLAAAALLPPMVLALRWGPGASRLTICAAGLAAAVSLGAGAALGEGRLFAITPSPWQTLPQLLMLPGTRVLSRQSGPWGRLTEVESPYIRFAPGLSLQATAPVAAQRGLVIDGDSLTVLLDPAAASFARSTHAWAGYVLTGADGTRGLRILVVHGDGGLATACALASGSDSISVVTENVGLARRLSQWYAGVGITVIADNPRSLLARRAGSWDIIHIEKWGPSVPGMAGLAESALLTTDALGAAWGRLADGGVLLVSRKLLLPPSDSVRIVLSVASALRAAGVPDPAAHVAVIRGTESLTVIASRRPLRGPVLDRLRSFAGRLGFDLDWFPGMTSADADRFQRFERPFFFEAYVAALSDPGLSARYPLDVAPQSDDRPFPNRFLRWTRIGDFRSLAGGRISGLLLSTELVGGAAFAVSVVGAAGLLGLPFALRGRRRLSAVSTEAAPERRSGLIAACAFAGAGFLCVEICIIDAAAILLPGPLLPLAISLGALLGFGTLGGLASLRLGDRALLPTLACLALVLAGFGRFLVPVVHLALPLAPLPRAFACVAGIAAPAFLLGVPFPLLLRRIAPSTGLSLAWAANGCASVLSSSASALIAAAAGLSILPLLGGACYLAAAVSALTVYAVRARYSP
jgi:hypothetical protein